MPSQDGAGSQTASAYDAEAPLSRWFSIDNLSLALRFRAIDDSDGVRTYNQAQQRSLISGKVKLDREGKYSVAFRLSSGHYFDWAFADFIGGGATHANQLSIPRMASPADRQDAIDSGASAAVYQSGGWALLPRQLYFDAKPFKGLELQYGSLGINRGVGTEITTYDDDGYIAGERLIVRQPKYLFVDEVSVTYAYLGDVYQPNFFERADRLGQSNYHQFLVRKRLTPFLDVSADYTWHLAHTVREAAYLTTKHVRYFHSVADGVRFEAYQRLNTLENVDTDTYPSGSGFAVTVNKTLRRKVDLQAGFANIDTNYDVYSRNGNNSIWGFALNGDQFGIGKRPFVRTTVKLTPYLQLFGLYSHLIDYNYARDGFIWNQTGLNAGLQIDFKNLLKLNN